MNRVRCEECDEIFNEDQVMQAPNPFDPAETISGCPSCKEVNRMVMACDVPGCSRPWGAGTPTASGYRLSCGEHAP